MGDKLYKGLRIEVWKMGCGVVGEYNKYAGGYSVIRVDMFSKKLILEISGGEPFDCAYQDAEDLAVLIDAELILKVGIIETIMRKSITGEYK